jgi:hypothetical protein
MYGKTIREQYAITMEAERRVRAGESQADVAQALGIPTSTVADWARKGGWRRKDLVAVRNVARGDMILGLIDEITAEEHARQNENIQKLRQALEASKAELETVAPGGQLPLATGGGVVPAGKLAMAMADNLLRQGQLEDADRAVRLAVRFTEAERTANVSEETKWREERERLMKWWAETQTAYRKLHTATEKTMNELVASMQEELSRSDDECCPKCGRRMDFWPEEVEGPDDESEDESGESVAGESESGESGEFSKAGSGESGPLEIVDESSGDRLLIPRWPGD